MPDRVPALVAVDTLRELGLEVEWDGTMATRVKVCQLPEGTAPCACRARHGRTPCPPVSDPSPCRRCLQVLIPEGPERDYFRRRLQEEEDEYGMY